MSSFPLETISDIFGSGSGSSSENLLAEVEKSADVSLKPMDSEVLTISQLFPDQTPESGDEAMMSPRTEAMTSAEEIDPFKENEKLKTENEKLKTENEKLKTENEEQKGIIKKYVRTLELFEREKNGLEDRIYSKFLPVLNSKKEEILRLQKLLSQGTEAEVDYGEDVDTDVDEEDGEGEKKRQKL